MKWYHQLKILAYLFLPVLIFYIFRQKIINFLGINHHPLEEGSYLFSIIGGYLALGTLILILFQIAEQNRLTKRQRTYDLVSKYYAPDYHEYIFNAAYFISLTLPYPREEQFLNRNHPQFKETRKMCILLFNYLEDACQMYNMKLVDNEIFERALGGVITSLYKVSEDLIKESRRRSKDNMLFIEWEKCALTLNAKFKREAAKN